MELWLHWNEFGYHSVNTSSPLFGLSCRKTCPEPGSYKTERWTVQCWWTARLPAVRQKKTKKKTNEAPLNFGNAEMLLLVNQSFELFLSIFGLQASTQSSQCNYNQSFHICSRTSFFQLQRAQEALTKTSHFGSSLITHPETILAAGYFSLQFTVTSAFVACQQRSPKNRITNWLCCSI